MPGFPRPARRLLLLATLALGLAACGKDPVNLDAFGVAGTYTLRTINGQPLPFTLAQNERERVEILSATLRLFTDLTFTEKRSYRSTEVGVPTLSEQENSGIWVSDGGTVTMDVNGAQYSFTVDGTTLVEEDPQYRMVWGR